MSTENMEREVMETEERNIFKRPGSEYWQIRYSVRGRKVQQSTGETSLTKARKFYENEMRLAKHAGRLAGLEESVTYEDIRALIVQDYEERKQNLRTLERPRLPHLDNFFGRKKVVAIGAARRHISDHFALRDYAHNRNVYRIDNPAWIALGRSRGALADARSSAGIW